MKKMMLLLSLLASIKIQAYTLNENPEHINQAVSGANTEILLVYAFPDFNHPQSLLPAIQTDKIETELAGVSTAETQREVVKADLDEKEGRLDWKTGIIVLCVAFFVYSINKGKKQDID
ncbi:hypothetical protein [Planococcus soli]|uniref:hypothetical protein n=1 Tax=Planococcus soli TaxID=2666072 RepID=UPI00115E3ADB|nr:hypothetical protein [Planococcus soli]